MTDKPTSVPIDLVHALVEQLQIAHVDLNLEKERGPRERRYAVLEKARAYLLRELDAAHPVVAFTPQAEYPVAGDAAACQFRWKFADGGWSSWTKVASQDEAERLCRSHAVRGIEAEYRALYDRPLPTPAAQPADNAAGVQGSVSAEPVAYERRWRYVSGSWSIWCRCDRTAFDDKEVVRDCGVEQPTEYRALYLHPQPSTPGSVSDAVRETADLLLCPFCRGTNLMVERADFSGAYVFCNNCGARGPEESQESDDEETPGAGAAVAAWNRRAAPPAQAVSVPEATFLIIGYGESDIPDARYATTPEEIRAAFAALVFGDPKACGEEADSEIEDLVEGFNNPDEWSGDGRWSITFEIGGINAYRLAAPAAATREGKE